jgi:hypothetical protein
MPERAPANRNANALTRLAKLSRIGDARRARGVVACSPARARYSVS